MSHLFGERWSFSQGHLKKPVTLGSDIPSPAIIKFLLQTRGRGRRREEHTDVRDSRVEDRGQGLVTWASNRLAFPFLPLQHNGLTLQCFFLTVTFELLLHSFEILSEVLYCSEATCSSVHQYFFLFGCQINSLNIKVLNIVCTEPTFIKRQVPPLLVFLMGSYLWSTSI